MSQKINHKDADTPEELTRWIWDKYVGVPVAGDAWEQEYEHLLDRVRRMDRSSFTNGLHEGGEQMKALASHAPSNDWPYIREQFRIEFGVEMETRYGGDIMNLMMSIRELLKKASHAPSEAEAQLYNLYKPPNCTCGAGQAWLGRHAVSCEWAKYRIRENTRNRMLTSE